MEYLETIYNVTMEGDPVIAARLAQKFNVSAPNVGSILQRMENDGLIRRDDRKAISLTDTGRAGAEAALRRHRLAERFLLQVLGLDWITAHEEAHHLEHGLTPEIEDRMDEVLMHPSTCPHGNPIPGGVPDASLFLRDQGAFRLSDATDGEQLHVVCVSEVVEDESVLLKYVGEKGMRPGASLVVCEREPGGALTVDIAGKTVAVGLDLATKVWVKRADASPSQVRPTADRQAIASERR
ncbi:MAG: metal-dependent transcriptional regulator [Chloroflexi bacterium]|nr:metal-dependent transcriptional regulator [Chloroflexota bacterium]